MSMSDYHLSFTNFEGKMRMVQSDDKETLSLLALMLQQNKRIIETIILDAQHNATEEDHWVRTMMASRPELTYPRIISLVLRENIKLHLANCKVTSFRNGQLALVAPVFGEGIHGYFDKDGVFKPNKSFTPYMKSQLDAVEDRGLEAVKEISQNTGHCCMCGRTLTNETSIEEGIGPICSGKMAGF
jgi:hypothetical protein